MAVKCQACGTVTGRRFTVTDETGTRRLVCTRCAYAAAPERSRSTLRALSEVLRAGVEVESDQGVLFGMGEEVSSGGA